jgi:hypothetical protein
VIFPKDANIILGLIEAEGIFKPNLNILAMPLNLLTTLLKSNFERYMGILSNYIAVSNPMTTIKPLITLDLYLALHNKDLDTFIIRLDALDFDIGVMLHQIRLIINLISNSP